MAKFAQLISMKVKPDKHDELRAAFEELRTFEKPGGPLVRTTIFRDMKDPNKYFAMPVFISEEAARERERDGARQERLKDVQAKMGVCLERPMEFTDLEIVEEAS